MNDIVMEYDAPLFSHSTTYIAEWGSPVHISVRMPQMLTLDVGGDDPSLYERSILTLKTPHQKEEKNVTLWFLFQSATQS